MSTDLTMGATTLPTARYSAAPAPSTSSVRLMTKIARMYHERGIRQADIAATLHLSQAKVSRLLKRAAEVGIVRTTVVVDRGVHPDLEEALEQRYGLREAVVVDAEGDERDITAALGSAAAGYLESTLAGGDRIGISSWSQTLLAMVDRMRPSKARAADSVVQLLGGMGVSVVQGQAQRLLGQLARLLGAEPVYFQAPGLVSSATVRKALLGDPTLEAVTKRWDDLTLALLGIGSIEPSPLLAESGNAFPPDDQERLVRNGAVGDVCYHFFTADGAPVGGGLDSRIVAIPTPTLRAIPRRIGIAGGERKHEAIRAAVVGGWVNVLLTDLGTAEALLDGPTPTGEA